MKIICISRAKSETPKTEISVTTVETYVVPNVFSKNLKYQDAHHISSPMRSSKPWTKFEYFV